MFLGTISSLTTAAAYAKEKIPELTTFLYLADNEYIDHSNFQQAKSLLLEDELNGIDDLVLEAAPANLGYGQGHNKANIHLMSDYHLVLNPDIVLKEDALYRGLKQISSSPDIAMLSPKATDGMGTQLYLCKQFPRIFDLLLRGYAPNWLKHCFRKRLAYYEMHELIADTQLLADVPIVSGCCMLMRTESFLRIGGFDPEYFLYFEDFDLSLRICKEGRVVYMPSMLITHYGGYAATKGIRHLILFAISGIKFYRRHGWKWF